MICAASSDCTQAGRIAALHAIRDSHAGQAGTVQCARLLQAMQTLGSVTTVEASRYLDVYDPPARKLNLVKAGHAILMTWDRDETESGEVHRVGRYSLVRSQSTYREPSEGVE